MSWLRGGIRRSLWNRHPIKLEFIKNNRLRIDNPNPSSVRFAQVWGGQCAMCNSVFVQKDLQVDHKHGEHSLKDISDIQGFIEGLVINIEESSLQFLCKSCHKLKTQAERKGISVEELIGLNKQKEEKKKCKKPRTKK